MADGSIRIETKLDNTKLKQQIKELERELNNIQKEQAKVDAQVDAAMAKYQAEREFDAQFPEEFSHRQEIDKRAAAEIDPLIAKQETLNQKEQQYLTMLDQAKAKLAEQARIAEASKQVDNDVKGEMALGKVQSQAQYNSLLDATASKMAAIEASAARHAAQTGLAKDQILAANPQYQKLKDTMGMLKAKAKDFGNEAQKAGKKASTAMKETEKSTKKVGTATKNGVAGFGKMQLIMMGIMMATRAITSATQEYLATNEELKGQLNTLKSLWGQILGPVIESVINRFIQAIQIINSFVAALTGINFIAKANAAAMDKQAQATNKAAKAAQLAGFDEQTKLTDPTAGSSTDPVTPLDANVEMPAWLENIKEQLQSGEFFDAGWSLAEYINEQFESVDWEGVGNKIGEVIGGIIQFGIGLALGIDTETTTQSILGMLGGLLSSLGEKLQELDWQSIGARVVDCLMGGIIGIFSPQGTVFVKGAAKFLGALIGAILGSIAGSVLRLWEIGKSIWEGIRGWFDENIDWEGTPGDIIQGLWDGIKEAFSNVWEWVKENIWVPFRDAFKEAFGIASPSKKMKEFGHDIIDGLKEGILGKISTIKQACIDIWEAIKQKFANVGKWFKETFSGAWQKVKDIFTKDKDGKIFDGIKEGISETFKNVVNKLIDGINTIIRVPFNKINSMLNTIRGITVFGAQPFLNMWGYNPLNVPQIPKLALGGIVNRPGRGVPAIIGEAGAEAVLPLENNTEWMDILADKISGGNVTIPIYMDGKKIATYVVDIQKKKAFAMNGA